MILTPEYKVSIAVVFFGLSMSLVLWSIVSALTSGKQISKRLAAAGPTPSPGMAKPKFGARIAAQISLPGIEEITKIRYLLSQAGFFSENAVGIYYGIRMVSIIVPQILILGFWGLLASDMSLKHLIGLSAVAGLVGFMAPQMIVNTLKKRRSLVCKEGFPDMMDLLVACIEAGLGLDAALVRVSNELAKRYPPLKIGLDLMNLELRAGRERHEALKNFADRLDLDEAKALAVMLRQSEEMGSSLGEALRTFSEDMRAKRMLRAEEKALALSAKLTVPLILFIFPTIMVMLLMPAGIRLAAGL